MDPAEARIYAFECEVRGVAPGPRALCWHFLYRGPRVTTSLP